MPSGDSRLAPMVPARPDAIGLPYTGAGTNAWLDTLSKIGTKLKLARAGTADARMVGRRQRAPPRCARHRQAGVGAWLARHRSQLGVRGADAARAIAERTLRWNTEHFAEGYIDGREFASAMMEGPNGVELLPIRETVFQGFDEGEPLITDYDAKWTPGSQPFNGTPRQKATPLDLCSSTTPAPSTGTSSGASGTTTPDRAESFRTLDSHTGLSG